MFISAYFVLDLLAKIICAPSPSAADDLASCGYSSKMFSASYPPETVY